MLSKIKVRERVLVRMVSGGGWSEVSSRISAIGAKNLKGWRSDQLYGGVSCAEINVSIQTPFLK